MPGGRTSRQGRDRRIDRHLGGWSSWPARSSTSSRTRSRRCSTASRAATTSPTTCCPWARRRPGGVPSCPRSARPPASGSWTWPPGPARAAPRSPRRARTSCRATSPSACSRGRQARSPRLAFTAGDALRLPFADATFDAVTISFGLRNVADIDAALAELLRVTRPGGRLVVCEFSHPTWAPFRTVYIEYLMRALPAVARPSSQPGRLRLPGRVDPGLARPARAGRPARRGRLGPRSRWRNLTGGIVALHRAHPRPQRLVPLGLRQVSCCRRPDRVGVVHEREAPHGCRRQDQQQGRGDRGKAKEAASARRPATTTLRPPGRAATRPRRTSSRPARRSRTPSRTEVREPPGPGWMGPRQPCARLTCRPS